MIATIKARCALIANAIPQIKRVYANAPQSLPDSDLPILCIFVGPSTLTFIGETILEETRTFILRLYVAKLQQGYDGEAERKVEPFLSILRTAFLSHPLLGDGTKDSALNFVRRALWQGDNGIQVLSYGDTSYLGVEFRLNVEVFSQINLAKYE